MKPPDEPTSEDCSAKRTRTEADGSIWLSTWYPQMGGYGSRCVVRTQKAEEGDERPCFDVWVWHDGEFPFSDETARGRSPAHLHHCMAEQFVRFGQTVAALQVPTFADAPRGPAKPPIVLPGPVKILDI